MSTHARYNINISDATIGKAKHSVQKKENSRWDFLPKGEFEVYQKDRDNNEYDDLDFSVHYRGTTRLHFNLSRKSSYVFADPPFTYAETHAPENLSCDVEIKGKGRKRMTIYVKGSGRRGQSCEIKYTLHYLDENGVSFDFDPIIRNGSIPPAKRKKPKAKK